MQSIVSQMDEDIQKLVQEMQGSVTLAVLIWQGLKLGRLIAVRVIEAIILERVQEASPDLHCESCGNRLESKGQLKRQLVTIVGIIEWKRQVKRCPSGCKESQVAPLDQELGLSPNQRTGPHLKRMACSLAVFVPFEIAATLLCLLTGVEVSSSSIWNWVQEAGERAMNRLQTQLDALASGAEVALEHMSDELKSLTMLVGADGVMAPFRPNKGTAQGRTVWREVKVGIVARWQTVTLNGKQTGRLMQRRVTACLGHIDDFKPRLWLLACQQGVAQTTMVVWLSDGGRGFWGVFYQLFQPVTVGILDFYHASQNLWKAAAVWMDGRTRQARSWFQQARRNLKHGHALHVLLQLHNALQQSDLPQTTRQSIQSTYDYLFKHYDHIQYDRYLHLGIPIGSGFVESACKWLIQQRFKGVGMRWSEDGFNRLLHLRLAWVNGSFDDLFQPSPNSF
jgi:hypothetical protein